jgi:hypothetical protein
MGSNGSSASICNIINCPSADGYKGNSRHSVCQKDCGWDMNGRGSSSDMGGIVDGSVINESKYPSEDFNSILSTVFVEKILLTITHSLQLMTAAETEYFPIQLTSITYLLYM